MEIKKKWKEWEYFILVSRGEVFGFVLFYFADENCFPISKECNMIRI